MWLGVQVGGVIPHSLIIRWQCTDGSIDEMDQWLHKTWTLTDSMATKMVCACCSLLLHESNRTREPIKRSYGPVYLVLLLWCIVSVGLFMNVCLNCVCFIAEVATAKLLDLAEGANAALAHSGTKQTEANPFMVHNHATENNNTVWVRHASGWSVRLSCSGLDKMGREEFSVRVKNYLLYLKEWLQFCCSPELDNSPLNRTGLIKWSHSCRGCGYIHLQWPLFVERKGKSTLSEWYHIPCICM